MVEEIAAAALIRDGKALLVHRHPQRAFYPDCWDLPGGHLEAGERADAAVRRECREELGVDLLDVTPIDVEQHDPALFFHVFIATGCTGEPWNAAPDEHDDLAWFGPDELSGLVLADPGYADWLPALMTGRPAE